MQILYSLIPVLIREHAEDKVHSRLGFYKKLKKDNPEIIIGVLGCMAQEFKR